MTASLMDEISGKRDAQFTDSKERDKLKAVVESWRKQGYVVTRLEKAMAIPNLEQVRSEFQRYEADVRELGVLAAKFKGLKGKGPAHAAIKSRLNDPDKVWEVARDIDELIRAGVDSAKQAVDTKQMAAVEKERRKLVKIEAEKARAEAERLEKEARVREEERKLHELDVEVKRLELARAEALAKASEDSQKKAEAELQKLKESRETVALELQKEVMAQTALQGTLGAMEKEFTDLKAKLVELESRPIGVPMAQAAAAPAGPTDDWKCTLSGWEAPGATATVDKIQALSDDDYLKLMRLVVKDKQARMDCAQLIEKWNEERYFRWFPGDIIEVKVAVVGGLYALARMLSFGEIKIYVDHMRYFDPIIKMYNRPENKYYEFPPIKTETIEYEGDKVARFYVEGK